MPTYKWTSDSVVEIHAKSSVKSIDSEVHDVQGEVSGELKDGQISLDPMPQGWVQISVDSLKSGKKLEDYEMRRRIDAKKFPTIRFDMKEASGGPEKFKLKCALTFHGVTKDFEADCTARLENGTILVEGEHTFNIEDYGVKAPNIMGIKIFPDVNIVARLVGKEA